MSKAKNNQVAEREVSDSDNEEKFNAHNFFYNTPGFMSSLMRKQVMQEMVKALPKEVQNRITVLKNIQLEQLKLESEFYEEVYALEKKYHAKFTPLFEKRRQIVTGDVEPATEEPKWPVEEEVEPEMTDKMKQVQAEIQKTVRESVPEGSKGIPLFWLNLFKNTEVLAEMIQEHDEAALKSLQDIKIVYSEENSFRMEFHFGENEFFTDKVLTKQYFLRAMVDPEFPFAFEGPEIFRCIGCNINWHKGKNLTVKTIRKKQKHKERGAIRTITKQVPNDSFFNFFNPPEEPENKEDIDDESQGILATDFEIGHFLRARVVPKAVLYYTGDVVDEDDEEDDYEDEEEEEEEEEEDSSDDGGPPQQKRVTSGGGKKPTPNECPNQ